MLLANLALPSFIGHGIVFALLLPLVAAIEAVVLSRMLKIPPVESFFTAAHANWRSTLAGLPAGWCMAWWGLIPAGMFALLLPPEYRDPSFQIIAFAALTGGIIPTRFCMVAMAMGTLLMLIPYYIASVRVEQRVVKSRHPEIDPKAVIVAVRQMNRVTYALLALLLLWWLMIAVVHYCHTTS